MKRSRIVFESEYRPSPVSFWVHRQIDEPVWSDAKQFDPPLPGPVGGKGWPRLEVEFDGVHLVFASTTELEHVIDVLSRNPLPTTRRLAEDRGAHGPNSHWLSRLPSAAKPYRFRRSLVKHLRQAAEEFAQYG